MIRRTPVQGVYIEAGDGNDLIESYGDDVSISAGAGADTIRVKTGSTRVFVNAGTGNDSILGNGSQITYIYNIGDGNDTIYNFSAGDQIKLADYDENKHSVNAYGDDEAYKVQIIDKNNSKVLGTIYLKGLDETTNKPSLLGGSIAVPILDSTDNEIIENNETPRLKVGTTGNDTDLTANTDDEYMIKLFAGNDSLENSGNYVSIDAGAGKDSILNSNGDYVSISGGANEDDISITGGSGITVNAGAGNDSIHVFATGDNGVVYEIKKGDGVDLIRGFRAVDTIHITDDLSIAGGEFVGEDAGAYVLTLSDKNTKISLQGVTFSNENDSSTATFGANALKNSVTFNVIYGSSTDTELYAIPNEVSIEGTDTKWLDTAGSGTNTLMANNAVVTGDKYANTIINLGVADLYIDGGKGDDSIEVRTTTGNTIVGGEGNDSITFENAEDNGGHLVKYTRGDGNDVITGWKDTDSLQIAGVTNATQVSYSSTKGKDDAHADVIIQVGTGKITLKDVPVDTVINISSSNASLKAFTVPRKIEGTSGNDSLISNISEDSDRYSILAYGGNDTIQNKGSYVFIDAASGNDSISNEGGMLVSILGGAGNDTIFHDGQNVSINAGANADVISLSSTADQSSVEGGTGDDTIYSNESENGNMYIYNKGDGSDLILGYNSKDSINILGSNISVKSSAVTDNGFVITLSDNNTLTFRGTKNENATGDELKDFDPLKGQTRINLTINGTAIENSDTLLVVPMQKNVVPGAEFINPQEDENYSIVGASNADSIINYANSTTIIANAGNDIVVNLAENVSINTGAGDDLILMDTVDSSTSGITIGYNNPESISAGANRYRRRYNRWCVKCKRHNL